VPTRLSTCLAALLVAAPAASALAADGVPLSLAEGQVVTLQFDRAVAQVAVTDLAVLRVKAFEKRVEVTGSSGGRSRLLVELERGGRVAYEVQVVGLSGGRPAPPPPDPNAIDLSVGDERRIPAAGASRLLVEEGGVARVRAEAGAVVVTALLPGTTSVIVVDGAGAKTTYTIRVR
jgi:Pilus formation protein N terminal region